MNGLHSTFSRRAFLRRLSIVALGTSGCSSLGSDSSGDRLRVGTIQPPVTLDPLAATYVGSEQAIERIFEGLYTYDRGLNLVPRIATGRPTRADPTTLTVELDSDATFQNGRPVTPADVRYSFEAPLLEDAPSKWVVSPLRSVDVVDDRRVRFRLSDPYPGVEDMLTRPIVPERAREADRERFAREPVGAGPYRVRSFSEGKRVELRRWEDYWGDPTPAIEAVTFAHVESPITQLTGLASGQSDAIEPISPLFRPDIGRLTDATVAERDGFRSLYFGFNTNQGPTTDRAVRQGIVRCIDLERAVSEFVEPTGSRTYSLLPGSVAEEWGFPVETWAAALPSKDVDGARRYFDRASTAVGRLKILTSKDPVWRELGEALAAGLRDAGQSALVDAVEWSQYLDRYVTGAERDYAVYVGEVAGTADPDSFLYPVFHENMEGLTNGIFYNEEPVMNALQAARRTTDRARRKSHYQTAITRLIEDRTHLPVCSFRNSFAHDSRLEGFRVHPIARLNPRLTSPAGAIHWGDR